MAGAFKKGADAHQNGQSITDCPYKDKRKEDGRLTFSRAFVRAWHDGWQWAAQQGAAKE
ncbi:Rmf/CrpP family protein [Acidithiobacillus ferriphilus]|uniref:Rmf/CrpP family protein n=1 Tax=Acidithiobacillus ferriphilus TaxID=1689834 RepID=UPI00350F1E7F